MSFFRHESRFGAAEFHPPDAIFDLTRRYLADKDPNKVNLGQGTYRDEHGQPWVLPSVRAAKQLIAEPGHEYLPIRGLRSFCDEAAKLALNGTTVIKEQRVATCQALSGTGALLLAGLTLKKARTVIETIYITDPTWSNHQLLFQSMGFTLRRLPYYKDGEFDFDGYINALKKADQRSAVVLHACAHNPTGCDPTRQQWREIVGIIKENGIFPIFDAAYLGFSSGSVHDDAWAIRHLVEEMALEVAICMSFAKSMGLYGERVGAVLFVTSSAETQRIVTSILENVQRSTISNPPAYGARIAATVLSDPAAACQWSKDLVTMSTRIRDMRKKLYDELMRRGTPGDWSTILKQNGMFGYTGISPVQIARLRDDHHIYIAESSRISVAGLNGGNVEYVAEGIDKVVRAVE